MGLEEQSDRAMMAAVRAGDLNALKELVSNGADPNAKDSYGQPILLGAANNVGILKYLLEDVHLPIEACDKHGYTPLLRASASGNLSVVQYLVSSGANLLARTALGETALHLSARSESVETFQFLQQSGVPMDILDIRGRTVLHHAAQFSCPNMVEYILKGSWWPVDCQDKNGQTPLMLTADFPRNEFNRGVTAAEAARNICDMYEDSATGQNMRDRITYIHWFHMSEGYLNKVIRLLVDAGADLSIQDVLGRTVLHQALGYKENFEFLWDKCPEFTHSVDKKGQTPIQIALLNSRYRWDRRYVIRKLLEAGADFKSVGEDGKTALSVAAEQYSYDIVNSLIKAGAETSCCNKDTLTQILYLASGKDDFELTNKVIAEGADVNGRKIDRYPSSTEKGHTVRCLGCYTTGCQVHSELSGHSPLFQTLHSLKMVMLLIGAGADVNFKDNYGCSPLHTALECGHHEVLDVLLDAGGDPNAVDDCGVSLLHTIASRSVAAMVYHTKLRQKIMRFTERLIEAGANINIMDHQGRTPLHYIAVEGNNKGTIQLTEKMIEAGARVDVADHHGRTPLHYVGQSRNLGNYKGMQGIKGIMQLTRMMIEAGARVNVADDHGRTPLHYAAQAGNYKYVKELLKAGADVNAMDMDGATPLLMQSSRNYHEVTQLLVRAGADVTASAKNCQRIIHRASQVGSTTDIDYLFDIWPSNWGSDNQGNTILHFATTCSRNRLQFIEQIVSRKLVFVDERNVHGETPLAMLVKHSSKCNSAQDEVEILLGAGANPTTKDNNGNTPLHMASSVGNVKVMELLIKAGIDFTLKDVINQTSLKWTSSAEGVEDADHVRNQKKAAIIDEKNNEGQTPLLLAAGCRDAVSLLLREGASISVKDHSGKTPLQVAINQGSHSAVRLLWGAGSNFLDIPQECRNKAVHLAVTSGDLEVLEHLISLGLSMSDNWWDPDHKTTLLHCAAKCNVEMLKYLKNQDYMEHGLDYKGRTALHCAVLSSNHIVAKYLLEEVHVPVDERDNDGMTALMLAASNMQYYDKQFDMFEILVNAGADVNIRDRNGKAIYEMVDYTRADMTKELLDYMQYRLSSCMDK